MKIFFKYIILFISISYYCLSFNNYNLLCSNDSLKLNINNTKILVSTEQFIDTVKCYADSQPSYDYKQLKKNIIFPEIARSKSIEGQILLKVLIDSSGNPIMIKVISTDSVFFEKCCIDAIIKTKFQPALINGSPTTCWVSIPIQFRMK